MRRTLLYIVLLAVLGFGVYYFLFYNRNESPYSVGEAGFTIKDTASIGKIFLADKHDNKLLLERTDTGWIADKKYKVLPSTLNQLLSTIAAQAPLYPVPQSARNVVIKGMAGESIKVEVYDRQGQKMRVFYVGSAGLNGKGTNMLMEGASSPYVVHILGFDGYLTTRYSPYLRDWRDRTVFNIQPEQIKRISVQYADAPLNSFVITKNNDSLTVDGDPNIVKHQPLNVRRARVYLKYFTDINAEGYTNGEYSADTIADPKRLHCTIDVTSDKGLYQHLVIYWMPLNRRSKNMVTSSQDLPDNYDGDRFYGLINNNTDTVVIQNYVFKKLFRNAYEFYEADPPMQEKPEQQQRPKNVLMHKNS